MKKFLSFPTWAIWRLTHPSKSVALGDWANNRTSYTAQFDNAIWVWVIVILILLFQ